MYYYEVWVSSPKYHGKTALTYSADEPLEPGRIVTVPLLGQTVAAVALQAVPKPSFVAKPIVRVVAESTIPLPLVQLVEWLQAYYPAPLGQITSLIIPSSLTQVPRPQKSPQTGKQLKPIALPVLTDEQSRAVADITAAYPQSVLLHGDTGTGKTRVYLDRAATHIEQGQSVIVLTPEIGLTPQLALTCEQRFPGQTVVLHSNMTTAQRRGAWLRILEATEPLVVVGPRSALFAPLKNIGLIVMDEAHDTAYKQEQSPHYAASRVAARLAHLHGAQLIMGSATPLVADYYTFDQKSLPIIRMQQPAVKTTAQKAIISLVDLKNRYNFTKSPWLANDLLSAIQDNLHDGEQSLVFLNRRGTARLVLCQQCGWQAHCPRCDLPLTYHGDKHIMRCHTCGFSSKAPLACPDCKQSDIVFKSIGTKSIVSELQKHFPEARIMRFDSDTGKNERLEEQFEHVRSGAIDILVGTQVLGKGLDLPKLSLLGVVLADTGLSFPDFTAEEQTFQLLTQVIGRVSRGHLPGTVFLQTHNSQNPVLQAAIRKDYQSFYDHQLAERQQYLYPPFCYLLKLTCTRASAASAQKTSAALASQLRKQPHIQVIGPSPAFVEKTFGRFKWQLTIKATNRPALVKICQELPANWSYDLDPANLL
jgi:primosomal protein N' (replication factor Y)